MSAIEYYHIELDTHEVLYAEGALVESFIDDDGSSRENFSNFVQYERLYGVERQSKMTPFAPILMYRGRGQELKGLVRSLVSNVVDVRDPIQIAYDQIAKRAEAIVAVPCSWGASSVSRSQSRRLSRQPALNRAMACCAPPRCPRSGGNPQQPPGRYQPRAPGG
jgi:hypothetical protein